VTSEFGEIPTGKITFYDGATLLKTSAMSGSAAVFTAITLARGTHTIKPTYLGGPTFNGSSSLMTQTVN
jgi:Bacterial Ig-like domain (group 3)